LYSSAFATSHSDATCSFTLRPEFSSTRSCEGGKDINKAIVRLIARKESEKRAEFNADCSALARFSQTDHAYPAEIAKFCNSVGGS